MTRYLILLVVLEFGDVREGDATKRMYRSLGVISQHGAQAALRRAGEQFGSGTYVAIPESRWTEAPVATETLTRVRVGS